MPPLNIIRVSNSRTGDGLRSKWVTNANRIGDQWPQFRGPNGAGVGEGTGYPVEFSPSRNLAWKANVPFGQSSPEVADNRLYLTAPEGEQLGRITVLKAGAEWDVLSVNDIGEEISATPALAAGRLYVRTRDRIYCFSQPPLR